MIISHKNKFIFFKPMKCAGSSIELALIPHCGDQDVITGSGYEEELVNTNFLYIPKNNLEIVEQTMHDGNVVKVVDPVYHTHTTPDVLRQKYKCYEEISDYYHFSIVRNPYDALVSYFWWAFYGPEIAKLSLVQGDDGNAHIQIVETEQTQKYDYELGRTIMPMVHDSDTVLRIKFQHFIESKSNFKENHPICNNKNTSVLNWFANLQNDFWSEDIDKIIRYESLLEDFNSVCNTFNISVPKMPKLKTSQRKANKHYSAYYNSYTRDIVHDAFSSVIKKFNYEF